VRPRAPGTQGAPRRRKAKAATPLVGKMCVVVSRCITHFPTTVTGVWESLPAEQSYRLLSVECASGAQKGEDGHPSEWPKRGNTDTRTQTQTQAQTQTSTTTTTTTTTHHPPPPPPPLALTSQGPATVRDESRTAA
jgi:hypothetical protein